MSFLNALASDGLSVGLRFYAARMNRAGEMAANEAAGPEEAPQTERMAEAERLAKPAPPPPPPKEQTPEEMAAGRAEAQAMLASDASLGRLQAARGESDQAEAAKLFAGGEETADASVMNGEMAAAEQLAGAAQVAGEAEEPDAEEGEEGEDGKDKAGGEELTQEEEEEVQEMKKRDREVRTHEQAHIAAGGGLAGAASYEYRTGPDGQKYAVGGEVPISSRGSSDPEQALRDAETVKRAAMAPAEPSSQDRSVAAQASADINRLRGEVAEARRKKMEGGEGEEGQAAKGLNSETAAGKAGEEEAGAAQASMNMAAQMTQSGQAQKARGQDLSQAGQAQKDQPAKLSGLDSMGIAAPKRLSANGESFGSHVLSAYAAAKSAVMSGYRPALATA